MAPYHYAFAELHEETWEHRMQRVTDDVRDLIAATRKVITTSREAMTAADETLKMRP